MLLEVCSSSYLSAFNAQHAGADRIELCQELSIGGITPSYGLLQQVICNLTIPVFVLIRPRSGNFIYSNNEFEIMKQNIQICKKMGCRGIVSGVLNQDNTINIEQTKELIQLSKPLEFTFHRAFDVVPDPLKALEQLITLGAHRILTSGQKISAEKGLKNLIKLKKRAGNNIIILPGSGINSKNVEIFKNANFKELHSSASKKILPNNTNKTAFFGNPPQYISDVHKIKSILSLIK